VFQQYGTPGGTPGVYQQPTATPGMTMASGGNRNVKNIPFDSKGEREWSNGLCSCFGDCLTCTSSTYLPSLHIQSS
jgi:hypothetical protein